ncbi:DUF2809 domain-containing protein [Uliginosibacterium flavum]|uniref:DUF2809 domain-containing protein n=1 Tax=Uliginosibacterium flavum TaxID=1396831 RepID=A0ABV2TQA3_9RHOO
MKFHFNPQALIWAILIFVIEVLIATIWSHHPWVRGFLGDALAVVWVYCLLRIVLEGRRKWLALGAFGIGCLVEFCQYVAKVNAWHLDSALLRTLLGSVADWMDVLAYALGLLAILTFEAARSTRHDQWMRC